MQVVGFADTLEGNLGVALRHGRPAVHRGEVALLARTVSSRFLSAFFC